METQGEMPPLPRPHAAFSEPVHLLDGLGEVMVCLEAQEMPRFKGGQPRGPGGFRERRAALDQASSLVALETGRANPGWLGEQRCTRDSRVVQVWSA